MLSDPGGDDGVVGERLSERSLTAAWAHRWPSEEMWRLRKN